MDLSNPEDARKGVGFVIPDDEPDSDFAIINRMAGVLRDEVIDPSIAASRLYHYHKAGVTEDQAATYDRRALILLDAWKRTRPQAPSPSLASIIAKVAATTSVFTLGIFLTGLASTYPAWAEAAVSEQSSNTPLQIAVALGLGFAFFAWVIVWAIGKIEVAPLIDDDDSTLPSIDLEARVRNSRGA